MRGGTGAAGFTLVELLVALAAGSLVVLGAYGAARFVADGSGREDPASEDALRVEAVLSSLRGWISGAYAAGGDDGAPFAGTDRERFGLPADEVEFVTADAGPLAARARAPLAVRLRVEQGERGGLVAEYRALGDDGPRRTLVLFPEVGGLEIRYRGRDPTRWLEEWSPSVRPPHAVRIRFHSRPGDSLSAILRLPLLVAPGASR